MKVEAQEDLDTLADRLRQSGDYMVFERLKPRDTFFARDTFFDGVDQSLAPTRIGIVLDVETTGLDTNLDEIIELGMVKFSYASNDQLIRVLDTFSAFNEPMVPITDEISSLTGITNEMVAGHRIDVSTVENFVADAVIIIAHNASFDRNFL